MEYKETSIKGVWIIEPKVFNDSRGYFFESWKKEEFENHIGPVVFVQEVIKGIVLDVAVDIRKSSPTFGRYVAVELSEENKRQLFIPRGMAHGFLVMSSEAIFTYKVDNVYAPHAEASIRFDDPTINIQWPIAKEQMLLSPKDQKGKLFEEAELFE